ncbi:leucine-rich repeat-containing protein 20-like isoform X1 [Pecten maximus]|uniref:leucine-rich repeat-containing protein 20-like isoform X1 n=1 Tax=Pecten maximus TaxID=6579 RepID=UPI001457F319|nr:leucine-rich repeat-containing protein 20-like isoform X1 [Pecten maximus]
MAAEAALVANRLQEAKESNIIDLTSCGLMKVPDAVYIFLKHTPVQSCSFSKNQLKRVPPRFPTTFKTIQELDLSDNNLSEFPEEMSELTFLQTLDISRNQFTCLPDIVYQYSNLKRLKIDHNHIADIDVERLLQMPSLQEFDLRGNPLTPEVACRLQELKIKVLLDRFGEGDT